MWGCGCVFGELLQRVAWIGKATTPQLQVSCPGLHLWQALQAWHVAAPIGGANVADGDTKRYQPRVIALVVNIPM